DYGVTRLSDWEFSVRGLGWLTIGPLRGSEARVEPLAEALARGGARVRVVDDIEPYRWLKLSLNAAVNPLTALLRAPNRVVLRERVWSIARAACEEVAAVARARGVELPEDPLEYLRRVAEATGENRSSMLADVEACRRTEVDYINGAVVRAAEELGLRAPVNRVLYELVKALEEVACAG
ncbi:MAG: 2-dehydropantoate 2-reductase, partial [Acidilobaceae archaeon]